MSAFACRRCGRCCEGPGAVMLEGGEPDRLASHLGLPVRDFIATYTRLRADRRGLCLTDQASGACVFLDASRQCRVHAVKPRQCLTFPVGWNYGGALGGCPGADGSTDGSR